MQIRSLRDREHAVALRKYFLRAVGSIHRHSIKHGRPQDNLFDRFDHPLTSALQSALLLLVHRLPDVILALRWEQTESA